MSRDALLRYNSAGVFLDRAGISNADLDALAAKLEAARRETLADIELFHSGATIPAEKQPLGAAFIDLPNRLLDEYRERRDASELGRILKTATRLRESVDRVVVLGVGGSYMGARALMDACCEPYFNELSRAERGSRPRMYFEGNNLDNDATQGLLRLLGNGRVAKSVDDRWAILVISISGETLETAVAFRQFLAKLRSSCSDDANAVAKLVVPVTGTRGKLFDLATALGCPEIHKVPDGVGGRFSILSAVGLLPAAVLGLNVVKLLEGAVAMNDHFQKAAPGENVVLDYVGVSHLMEVQRGASIRIMSVWSKALEAVGLWYDQLLAESLGKTEQGATPMTTVNTRDLHSRAQQHQERRRNKLITNVIVDKWRCDLLAIGHSDFNQDGLNDLAGKTLPELMSVAIEDTDQAYRDGNLPTADIHLPDTMEASIGQLFQMLMLATVVEGRLLGINPYGQSGVEGYKYNMRRILGR
ncbi:MAG: glucose-6-phosphate isomerase [Planctomycetales bacterium]|nr:glucose-6-phosphate isomerase [Planctomycetales bacterium]